MSNTLRRAVVKAMLLAPPLLMSIGVRNDARAIENRFQAALGLGEGDEHGVGKAWESLNPGYWRISGGHLRRVTHAVGDRARNTGFPYHYESKIAPDGRMPRQYDPSLPMGLAWNRQWKLTADYTLRLAAVVKGVSRIQRDDDDPDWAMYTPGYGLFGLSFGGRSQFESFYPSPDAAPTALIFEDGCYGLFRYTDNDPVPLSAQSTAKVDPLKADDKIDITLVVSGGVVTLQLEVNGVAAQSLQWQSPPERTDGWFGLAARGLLDVEISDVSLDPGSNKSLYAPLNDCHVCYALGDTLVEEDNRWQLKFVALFRSDGRHASIRVADSPTPAGGWESVAVAGTADIISNEFRRNTAVVRVELPHSPAERTMYYTVWKDGVNVTADPRPGTDSVGPGTGLVGDVQGGGDYVGRLPRLNSPYRLCGLSCHAIHTASEATLQGSDGGHCGPRIVGAADENTCGIDQPFYVHDQPCENAFAHFEEFNYQILLWEDDVWYMELLLYPPSTDDAYKIITTSIAGPTTRWQMMRHWNVLNPGDHDYGMDDVKGPEQILIRNRSDLGQDPDYMVRNFQIVSHLMTGKEDPSGKDNPKRWRKWKMPNHDFSVLVMDSRLWRTSQDPAIWDDEGWGHDKEIYSRLDPTRTLLGEEQFAWLANELSTDSSTMMCLTGINVLHTIWGGHQGDEWLNELIDRDRVSADYAGWVKAGADRVLELISSRDGVISVFGDVHAGSIVRNVDKRIFECSFGPIGRWGGRSLIDGFGREMNDFDGRAVEVRTLYHHEFKSPDLEKQDSINYWNVLEAVFDTQSDGAQMTLAIRNITDSPAMETRGGGDVKTPIAGMGRKPTARLPRFRTLPNADVLFLTEGGDPIRGARSDRKGRVSVAGLVDVYADDQVTVVARRGARVKSHVLLLEALV